MAIPAVLRRIAITILSIIAHTLIVNSKYANSRILMSIADRIKNEGAKKNFTLASIERELGLGNGSIRRWDTSIPSADKLYKVAELLKVSMDYLYIGTGAKSEKSLGEILSTSENELLMNCRKLDSRGQHRVHTIIYEELDRIENDMKAVKKGVS